MTELPATYRRAIWDGRRVLGLTFLLAFLLYMLAPLLIIAVSSVGKSWFGPTFLPEEWGLDWYAWANSIGNIPEVLKNSLIIAAMAVVMSLALALPTGWALGRRKVPVRGLLSPLVLLPRMLPPIAFALGVAKLFYAFGLVDTLFGVPLADDRARLWLHLGTVGLAALAYASARWLGATQAGRLVTAIRDGENRVRFLGYSPAPYKILVFAMAGAFAGIAGALHTLHMGLISPAMVGVVPSIEMVVWVAVGGRTSLYGALVGTVVVNLAKDRISSDWPAAWPYVMGLIYIVVVIAMPRGLAGAAARLAARRRRRERAAAPAIRAARARARADAEATSHG